VKTITVDIGEISKAIAEIERYKREMDGKVRTLLERIAAEGIDVSSAIYKTAAYDGVNDVAVNGPEWIDAHTLAISATGHAVTFIEFGAGKLRYGSHPWRDDLGFKAGGYGKGQGAMSKHQFWAYKGSAGDARAGGIEIRPGIIKTQGNAPSRAMYEGEKAMRRRIKAIAKEVFAT
jgi:hypothetical protein